MKILLVDDEALARERLRDLLQGAAPAAEVVGEASNGLEALSLAVQCKPDVVLMDINMPGLDGIRCARELAHLADSPAVIFITAHEDFALQAFDVAACDYLLKPVREQRLAAALARAQRLTPGHWERLNAQLPSAQTVRMVICTQRGGEMRLIPVEEIIYFQADQKYTTVKTASGEDLIEDSLKSLEQEFGERFARVHRNALVAVSRIERLEKSGLGGGKLRLRGLCETLEVSRRSLPTLRALLKRLGRVD
jgi:two-component system response regulator AlgR